jgi:glycosyltransferase involved in cell wall biosynthesis
LEHFTGEIGHIRVSAIDNEGLPYDIPVDLIINQNNPDSWSHAVKDILARSVESTNPTIVILQHEYGLDPAANGNAGEGTNFVDMAKAFSSKGITTLVYLHSVLDAPNAHQKTVIQALAKYSDGLIVTTESAIGILESPTYAVDRSKIKHIDHGVRMQHPSHYDRLAIKEMFGLKDRFLVTTLGLLSPDKGLEYGIRGYGRFLRESCTEEQRKNIVYLIGGQYHPEFVKGGGGESYRRYQEVIDKALEESKLRWCKVKELRNADFETYDVVFLDMFLDEKTLLRLYGATNAMVLPYLDMQQISSGVLADTLGSGRVAIATKFRYAAELIHSNRECSTGLILGRHSRGILVDPGEASVEQIAEALDYLVFNKDKRLLMEKQAHQRGYQMRWQNTGWALLQHIEFVREGKEIITGRGITFKREKPSIFEKKEY